MYLSRAANQADGLGNCAMNQSGRTGGNMPSTSSVKMRVLASDSVACFIFCASSR